MDNKALKKLILCIFAAVFIVMFSFNIMTPQVSDDYAFSFTPMGERIVSFNQIIPSLAYHRENANGRVISHFFVYLFLLLPSIIYKVINAAVTTLIVYLVYSFFKTKDNTKNVVLLACAIFMIWIFTPEYGSVFLGLTGACNYSWALCIYLAFLRPFFCLFMGKQGKVADDGSLCIKISYIFLAFVAGAYSENGSTSALFVTCGVLLLMTLKKEKVPKVFYIAMIAFIMGFAFMMISPSELHGRTADYSTTSFAEKVKSCILALQKYSLYSLTIYFVLLVFAIMCKVDKRKIEISLLLAFGGIASIAIFVFAAYLPESSFYIITAYLTIASLILAPDIWENKDCQKILVAAATVMAVIFAFEFILGAGDIYSVYTQYSKRLNTIENAIETGEKDIILDPLISSTKYPAVIHEMLYGPDWWYNDCIASFYGLSSVTSSECNE